MKKVTSPYISVNESRIHNNGIFAKKFIPKGTRVIEYVGEKITTAESDRRADEPLMRAAKDKRYGAVYIFELNKRYDIDGNIWYNTARYINHSCNPNCETELSRGHIWIASMRDIEKDEEVTYNYGYDFRDYQDHKCECGSHNCIGFILAEEHWSKFKRLNKNAKTVTRGNC